MAWSTATALMLVYYSSRWLVEAENPLRQELLFGASSSLLAGGLAWLALPAIAFRTASVGLFEKWAFSVPSAFAALCLLILATQGAL